AARPGSPAPTGGCRPWPGPAARTYRRGSAGVGPARRTTDPGTPDAGLPGWRRPGARGTGRHARGVLVSPRARTYPASAGDLMDQAEIMARALLFEAHQRDGRTMARTWGEVVEAAG